MGLSLDAVNRLSASISGFADEWFDKEKLTENGFNANDKHLEKSFRAYSTIHGISAATWTTYRRVCYYPGEPFQTSAPY